MNKSLKTLDLFAGIGGVRLGFERAGLETVFANDIEPKCKPVYDANFKDCKLTVGDINAIDIKSLPDFDLLLGGFPCQSFSIAGYKKGFADKGRGDLFFRIAEIVEEKKPRAIFLENVKNLVSHDNGRTFQIVKETLEGLGYFVATQVMNTREYSDIPQNRERIYIVAFKDKKAFGKFKFPEKVKAQKAISEFLEEKVDKKYD